jgi:antirestriction factor ArdC-like protein
MAQSASRPAARARPTRDRSTLYEEITTRIIAELEAGRVPWAQPWDSSGVRAPLGMPKNGSTSRAYSGIDDTGSSEEPRAEFFTFLDPVTSVPVAMSKALAGFEVSGQGGLFSVRSGEHLDALIVNHVTGGLHNLRTTPARRVIEPGAKSAPPRSTRPSSARSGEPRRAPGPRTARRALPRSVMAPGRSQTSGSAGPVRTRSPVSRRRRCPR